MNISTQTAPRATGGSRGASRIRRHRTAALVTGAVAAVIAVGGGSAALFLPGEAVSSQMPAQILGAVPNDVMGHPQTHRVRWLQTCAPSCPAAAC